MIKSPAALHLRRPQSQQYSKCATFQFSNCLHWLVLLLRLLTCVGVRIWWRQTDKHSVSPVVASMRMNRVRIHHAWMCEPLKWLFAKWRIDCWRLQWNPFGAAIWWWWWCHRNADSTHQIRNGKIFSPFSTNCYEFEEWKTKGCAGCRSIDNHDIRMIGVRPLID